MLEKYRHALISQKTVHINRPMFPGDVFKATHWFKPSALYLIIAIVHEGEYDFITSINNGCIKVWQLWKYSQYNHLQIV